MNIKKLTIDGVDYTKYATMPLQKQDTIDESLDVVYVELKGTNRELPFRPFANVELKLGGTTFGMLVESDQVTEEIAIKKYNHDLLFVEQTKWAERLFVEKTIRQPLIHNYLETQTFAIPEVVSRGASFDKEVPVVDIGFKTPMLVGQSVNIYHIQDMMPNLTSLDFASRAIVYVYKHDPSDPDAETSGDFAGYVEIFEEEMEYKSSDIPSVLTRITLEKTDYIIRYLLPIKITFQYSIICIESAVAKPYYTIEDVCHQLLQNVECLCEDEEPLFSLAEPSDYSSLDYSVEYRNKIGKLLIRKSPEFTFSKMSLFEAFKLIGDWGHFIPRFINRKVYFDLLGQGEKVYNNILPPIVQPKYAKKLERYISSTSSQSSNDFCTKLDSQVSNLTNTDNEEDGAVTTPNNKEYRTVRTEENQVQISDENNTMFISEHNIEKVIKLEIGKIKIDGTDYEVGDIAPYVYEESEYNVLDSFGSQYPFAKMYALKYTKGEKNITELNFQRQNVVSQAFEGIAIKNIIFRKLGIAPSVWSSVFRNINTLNISYRLTYIPSTDARVIQSKARTEDIDKELSIAYNQSAGKLSSVAYGENLKGVIAKYGNVEKTKTYIFPPILDLVPQVGKLFDEDYYIATVKCEYYPTFIKCEVGLSKNYNNKSAYVETNSRLQFFEYDREIVIDRYIVREDYCVIGDEIETDSGNVMLTQNGGAEALNNRFYSASHDEVSYAKITAYNEDDEAINTQPISLSTISIGLGNSVLLAFKFDDSVSAGLRAYYDGSTKYQEYVKYVDDYGECYSIDVSFATKTAPQTTSDDQVSTGDNLPLANGLNEFIWGHQKFIIQKSVGEVPHFSYQLHFVTNSDIIIGSGMANTFPLVKPQSARSIPKLYFLTSKINKFDANINTFGLEGHDLVALPRGAYKTQIMTYDNVPYDCKAWAVVQDGEFLFGRNVDLKQGQVMYTQSVFLNLVHKLKEV